MSADTSEAPYGQAKWRFPDLVVCNTRAVIGIIELKYQPKIRPRWEKDLQTLEWLARNRKVLSVQNRRYRGVEADGRVYPLSPRILFVWAGVHAGLDFELSERISPELKGSFLELHAETSRDSQPTIRWRS